MRILLCLALLLTSCTRSSVVVTSLPENITGRYKISIEGESRPGQEADFLVFPDAFVPLMFPDSAWTFVKIESLGDDSQYRIYAHTANEPAHLAIWWTLRILGNGKLLATIPDCPPMVFTKVGELPRYLTPD